MDHKELGSVANDRDVVELGRWVKVFLDQLALLSRLVPHPINPVREGTKSNPTLCVQVRLDGKLWFGWQCNVQQKTNKFNWRETQT